MSKKIIGITAALTTKALLNVGGLITTSLVTAFRSPSLQQGTLGREFAKSFNHAASTSLTSTVNGEFDKRFNQFMKEVSLNIPIISPDTIKPDIRQAIAHVHQAKVVARLSLFLEAFFNHTNNISSIEMQHTLKRLLLTEAMSVSLEEAPEVTKSEPTFIDTKKVFAGKAAWESNFMFVNIAFKDETGADAVYRFPVRVTVLTVPYDEITKVLGMSLAISGFFRRFGSLYKGNISVSQYLMNSDYKNLAASLSRIAGDNWAEHIKKTKTGSSLLLDLEMTIELKEKYGLDIYHPKTLERVMKNSGIFEIFVVDEDSNLLESGSSSTDYVMKSYPLTQIYTNSKKLQTNSTISIQLNN